MALSLDRQNRYRERFRAEYPGWQPATVRYEALIRSLVTPGMRVLDIGCGRGGVLEQLGELVSYPIGLDTDLRSLREHRMPSLPRAEATSDWLPLRNDSIDLILSSWVFEHLDDPARTLREAARVLRPGGRLLVLTPHARSVVVRVNRLLKPLQRWLVPLLYGRAEADTFPVRYRINTGVQLTRLATASGLQVERIVLIDDPTYFAFNDLLYRASKLITRLTPPVHLIGILQKIVAQ